MSATSTLQHTQTAPSMDVPLVKATLPGHGLFVASAAAVDAAMNEWLPANAQTLRAAVHERCGFDANEYADVTSVSALIVVLASTSGYDQRTFGRDFG